MKAYIKKILCIAITLQMMIPPMDIRAEDIEIEAPSAILMETTTGEVLYSKNEKEVLPPASVTKIMTLLLVFDALERKEVKLSDEVVTSEYAASMGGSQVFLEPGEVQTVDTLIRCVTVASANDASVALAEHVSGTEEEFVNAMNDKAKELKMIDTNFKNCNGLDEEGHVTTANDIALMSRELMRVYPQVEEYTMIWMENITHETSSGTSEFGLSNTNKLVRNYPYTTGLKTGSTSQAKFCISATASKDDVNLIAVIMAAPNSTSRNNDAIHLLNYGFSKCQVYTDREIQKFEDIPIEDGEDEVILGEIQEPFTFVDTEGRDILNVQRVIHYDTTQAPVEIGDKVGSVTYELEGDVLGKVEIRASEDTPKLLYRHSLLEIVKSYLL